MDKHVRKTVLFFRIAMRLTFPLLLLISAFTAIQLSNQLSFLNKTYEIQNRLSLQMIIDVLGEALAEPRNFEDPFLLKATLENAKEVHGVSELLLLDPLTHKLLYSDREGKFTTADLLAMEKSLLDSKEGKPSLFLIDKDAQKLNVFVPIASLFRQRSYVAKISYPLGSMKLALQKSLGGLITMFLLTLLTGFLMARGLSSSIVKPIQNLNQATQDIVGGKLGLKVAIKTGDEIEELANTFNQMSQALKEMKERAEDANPLTQLPGNQGIYHEIQKRIYESRKFVCFHVDIDRFKIFNDHYGLARGDEAIRKTAEILREALNEKGGGDSFLGHQGGDDFIILTQMTSATAIAEAVIEKFNRLLRTLYRKEDYERGYVLEQDRRSSVGQPGALAKFPLIAISLAGITNTRLDFTDYFDLFSRAVEVKKKVKNIPESCYVIQE